MAKIRINKVPGIKKVRITGLPTAAYGGSARIPGTSAYNQMSSGWNPNEMGAPSIETRRTLQQVPRDEANIEAEKGETVLMPDQGGLPAHFNVGGNRHHGGGTPLNVPADSFVFSDTRKMRIKDPNILADFGKKKGSYTPAQLAKQYDINKYRKITQDPDSDMYDVETAEKMIANYNLKLGKLALVQESKKGFPQGIPAVAMPYLATFNINPDSVLPLKAEEQQTEDISHEEMPMGKYGMTLKRYQSAGVAPPPNPSWVDLTNEPDWNDLTGPPTSAYNTTPGQGATMDLQGQSILNSSFGNSGNPREGFVKNTPELTSGLQKAAQTESDAQSGFKSDQEVDTQQMNLPDKPSMKTSGTLNTGFTMAGEDAANIGIAGMHGLASLFSQDEKRNAEEQLARRFKAENVYESRQDRDRGDWTPNQGYLRPDQKNTGNMITGKYGGILSRAQEGQEQEADRRRLLPEESKIFGMPTYLLPDVSIEAERPPMQVPGFGTTKWGIELPVSGTPAQRAGRFAEEYPIVMQQYIDGLQAEHSPDDLYKIADDIEESRSIGAWGRGLGTTGILDAIDASSDADKFSDLASIIRERANTLKQKQRFTSTVESQEKKAALSTQLIESLKKKLQGMPQNSSTYLERIKLQKKIDDLKAASFKPIQEFFHNILPQNVLGKAAQFFVPDYYVGPDVPFDPYEQEDVMNMLNIAKDEFSGPDKPAKAEAKAEAKSVITPAAADSAATTTGPTFEELMEMEEGGTIPLAEEGLSVGNTRNGKTIAKTGTNKSGSTVVQYEDGTAEVIPKETKKSTNAGKTTSGKRVDPYGGYEELLTSLGVSEEDLYPTSIGHQTKESLGTLTPKEEEVLRRGNPTFFEQLEADGTKFDPSSDDHKRAFEDHHKKFTYDGFYNRFISQGMSETKAKAKATELSNKLSFHGVPGVDVNAADQKWGNWHKSRKEFNFTDPEEIAKKKKGIDKTPIIPETPAQYTSQSANAPWWTQDVINTASAAGTRWGLNKYMPWAPQVDLQTPRPTFFDPTRELAANAEAMAIGTQGAGMYGSPQQFSARASGIQGQGARSAANILSQYHNKNVGLANQFENLRTDIYNKNNISRSGVAKGLYDATTIANQQYDNAKREANAELRSAYTTALTNRAKTQALNTLFPHYQVDPSSGGLVNFTKGSPRKPTNYSNDTDFKAFMNTISQYPDPEDKKAAIAYYLRKNKGDSAYNDSELSPEDYEAYTRNQYVPKTTRDYGY